MRYIWTPERIDLLKKYYPNSSWDKLFEIFGILDKGPIIYAAHRFGVTRDVYNECHVKKEEEEFIKKYAPILSANEIGRRLNRNVTFVLRQMQRLGVDSKDRGVHQDDVELFMRIYPLYTNKYLSEKYFPYLTPSQIRGQARKFSLTKNKEKSIKWYSVDELLEKLNYAIKIHNRVPMLAELQDWGLPSDKTFKRYFGGLTQACKQLNIQRPDYHKPITHKEGVYYDEKGNVCLSLTEIMISNFLIAKGYSFEKEYLYKNIIPEKECGNKRFDWKINNKFIEFFGFGKYKHYDLKTKAKLELCKKYNVKLLALYPRDISSNNWKQKITDFLTLN